MVKQGQGQINQTARSPGTVPGLDVWAIAVAYRRELGQELCLAQVDTRLGNALFSIVHHPGNCLRQHWHPCGVSKLGRSVVILQG